MTIALIRHGQTDWNARGLFQGHTDVPLNDIGRAQAAEIATELRGTGPWRAIVSSPLSRARETAEIIAAALALPLGPAYPEWVERSYGVHEGAVVDRSLLTDASVETISQVIGRGYAALARVATDYPHGDTIVVTHGTIIRYTLNDIAGGEASAPIIPGIHNGALSTVTGAPGAWRVDRVNIAPDVVTEH